MKPDNDTLMAFADGALPDDEMARIEALIAEDAELAAIVARHRNIRRAVKAAYVANDEAPMSDGLSDLIAGIETDIGAPTHAPVVSLDAERTRRNPGFSRAFWPAAAAACFVMGIVGGLIVSPSSTGNADTYIAWQDGAPVAGTSLAAALGTVPSGEASTPVSISASFVANNGLYCRQFAIEHSSRTGGIACREDEAWKIVTLAALPEPGSYQAAGDAPDPLAATALQLGVKKKLSPSEEAERISSGWDSRY